MRCTVPAAALVILLFASTPPATDDTLVAGGGLYPDPTPDPTPTPPVLVMSGETVDRAEARRPPEGMGKENPPSVRNSVRACAAQTPLESPDDIPGPYAEEEGVEKSVLLYPPVPAPDLPTPTPPAPYSAVLLTLTGRPRNSLERDGVTLETLSSSS